MATVASALVTSYLTGYTFDGYVLGEIAEPKDLMPNYAFTQINPLPFEVNEWVVTIWKCDMSMLYVLGLYAAYVAIFYMFNGAYYAFLAVRKKILARIHMPVPATEEAEPELAVAEEGSETEAELAATDTPTEGEPKGEEKEE